MTDRASGLTSLVLGSAAGGGFPQWNCACRLCRLVRAGAPGVRPATQISVALSACRERWLVVGASPDLRQQILQTPALHPRGTGRDSPIEAVVLISADVDGFAGLLTLRERQRLDVFAPPSVMEVLTSNSVFHVLDPELVRLVELPPAQPVRCAGGLTLTLLPMPGKVPLYLEDRSSVAPDPAPTYAALVQANGRSVIVAPGCAEITEGVRAHLACADLLFFDGTVFTDDEMIAAGVGTKTGRRMGHVPISGPDGSLARLADLRGRRVFVHINNTNPILLAGSPERQDVEAAGFEVSHDGMEIRL
jgi:pyrroloquinoline quinone biosynthesis protein B